VDVNSLISSLCALTSVGFFEETNTDGALQERRFAQTPLSRYLCQDVPGSMYALVRQFGSEWEHRSWSQLAYSIRTGQSVVLRKLYNELAGSSVNWVVTGSLNFALQGLPIIPHDIDIQTDRRCAYEIERRFALYVTKKVMFSSAECIRSHFGALQIDGITVELMGDVQKRLEDGSWEDPVDLNRHKLFVAFEGMDVPVLSLKYEAQTYRKLGRIERAQMLQEALSRFQPRPAEGNDHKLM